MPYQAIWKDEKLNKNEIAKLEKDGLEVFEDLKSLVKTPFSEIDKSYYMYFKYAGLTVQKPQTDGLFMLRVKVPAGFLSVEQGRVIAKLVEQYGKGDLDITTRQSIQFHNVPFAKLNDIFAELESVGLTTKGSEGDINRNVVGNPLAGIEKNELFDASPVLMQLHELFQGNRDYSNLPRKFKISISTNIHNSANAQIHDLAFVPATKQIGNRTYKGFGVLVGGGLGAKPYLAQPLDLFVRPSQVTKVAEAVVKLYRDFGYRRSRTKARLKFLIEDWGTEKFTEELLKITGPLQAAGHDEIIDWSNHLILGVHPQRQRGYSYIGVSVPTGRISAADFSAFLELAEHYGRSEIRFDHSQNLLLPFLRTADLSEILRQPIFEKFPIQTSRFQDFALTCTGNEYCNLAYTETKQITHQLLEHLDETFQLEQPVKIILTGCQNACAHRNIADIGIQGVSGRDKLTKAPIEAFQIAVGGSLLGSGHYNEVLKGNVPKTSLLAVIEDLVRLYEQEKEEGETFYETYQKLGNEPFQQVLSESIERHG